MDNRYLRPEELHNLKGDCSKLKSELKWTPTFSFEDMLNEMIEYWLTIYKAN